MKIFWTIAAGCLLATAAHAAQIDDLKAGKLQCYMPNMAKHTCVALAGYTFGPAVTNQAEVLLSPAPLVTMKTNSVVTFENGAVCGVAAKADIDAAAIMANGTVLPPEQAGPVRANIWTAFAPRAGKKICTAYTPAADGSFTATYTIDGQPDTTTPSMTVILVDPKDGYTVGAP
jgi:hypothetical protein